MSSDSLTARLLAKCPPLSDNINPDAKGEPLCETDLPSVYDFSGLYESSVRNLIFTCMYEAKIWIEEGKKPSGLEEFLETFDVNATGLYVDLDGYRLVGGERAFKKWLMSIFDIDESDAVLIRDWLVWLEGSGAEVDRELLGRCLRYWNLRAGGDQGMHLS